MQRQVTHFEHLNNRSLRWPAGSFELTVTSCFPTPRLRANRPAFPATTENENDMEGEEENEEEEKAGPLYPNYLTNPSA